MKYCISIKYSLINPIEQIIEFVMCTETVFFLFFFSILMRKHLFFVVFIIGIRLADTRSVDTHSSNLQYDEYTQYYSIAYYFCSLSKLMIMQMKVVGSSKIVIDGGEQSLPLMDNLKSSNKNS